MIDNGNWFRYQIIILRFWHKNELLGLIIPAYISNVSINITLSYLNNSKILLCIIYDNEEFKNTVNPHFFAGIYFQGRQPLKNPGGSNFRCWCFFSTIMILFGNFSLIQFLRIKKNNAKSAKNRSLRKKGVLQYSIFTIFTFSQYNIWWLPRLANLNILTN